MVNRRLMALLLVLLLPLAEAHAQAESTPSETAVEAQMASEADARDADLDAVGDVLVVFLVLSLVFESAMSVLFDWRLFLVRFEGKGVKTPIIVGTAFLVFWGYDLDIVYDLLVALGYDVSPTLGGQVLTALLIAGGSGGIFRIFSRLGIRSPKERERKAAEARASLSSAQEDAPESE
jgi:hypothetical protein